MNTRIIVRYQSGRCNECLVYNGFLHNPSCKLAWAREKRIWDIRELKLQVWGRDRYRCRYCKRKMFDLYKAWKEKRISRFEALITVDHIIPTSKGGTWEMSNLVTACQPCNLKKGNKLPIKYALKKSISLGSTKIIYRLLEVLVVLGKWAEMWRLRNSPHLGKNKR